MDAHNLATLFGPNILHKAKGGEFEVTSVEHAEERHDVISVVKEMIEQHRRLFEVGQSFHKRKGSAAFRERKLIPK